MAEALQNKDMIVDLNENPDCMMKQEALQKVSHPQAIPFLIVSQARYAVETLKFESKISEYIKKFFDQKYGPNWHCIVGKRREGGCGYGGGDVCREVVSLVRLA